MSTQPSKMERKELLLPTEVIMDILSKLPTMSVLRFQCVSKKWFNILRDEYFRDLHSQVLQHFRSPSQSYSTILFSAIQIQIVRDPGHPAGWKRQPIITISSPGSKSHYAIKILSDMYQMQHVQCNGLLCMFLNCRMMERLIIVCNPLTHEYLPLPPYTTLNVIGSCYSLGFANLSKQYKVVCIHLLNGHVREGVMEVYTLGETTWRVVNPHVVLDLQFYQSAGLYADGKILWVICGPHPYQYCLLSFDVESEQASVIGNLPSTVDGDGYGFKLAQLESGVALFMLHDSEIEVWMLKRTCSSSDLDCLCYMKQRIRLPHQLVCDDQFVDAEEMFLREMLQRLWRLQGIMEFGDDDILIVLQEMIIRRSFYCRISSTRSEHGQFTVDYLYTKKKMAFWSPCCGYRPSLVSLKRYGCLLGERVVDGLVESPPNIEIPSPRYR